MFTAYLKQERLSKESRGHEFINDEDDNPHKSSYYPTIYFYGLGQKSVIWEIEGAEIFLGFRAPN